MRLARTPFTSIGRLTFPGEEISRTCSEGQNVQFIKERLVEETLSTEGVQMYPYNTVRSAKQSNEPPVIVLPN